MEVAVQDKTDEVFARVLLLTETFLLSFQAEYINGRKFVFHWELSKHS